MEEAIKNEFNLLVDFLANINIKTTVYNAKSLNSKEEYKNSVFSFFFKRESFERHLAYILSTYERNTLYRLTSNIFCDYYVFFIPNKKLTFVSVGPYTTKTITEEKIRKVMKYYKVPDSKYNELVNYYNGIKHLDDPSIIHTLINTFYSHVQGGKKFKYKEVNADSLASQSNEAPQPKEGMDTLLNMNLLAQRYELENQMLGAVSKGELHNAEMLLSKFLSLKAGQNRAENPIRNRKNYTIILNTLFRKSVEKAKVHPIHIDDLSSKIAYRIEECKTMEELNDLRLEMVRKYCMLVREHTIDEQHSKLIKQAITLINYDYTADLNLNSIASKLNVNASYLSTLFKQETNETLTEYVTRKRIEYATLLLNNSDLSISDIANFCGINDLQYFSKIFKKTVGHTPSEYKKLVRLTSLY